ncbi:MAG: hypothetical protein CMG25_04955 [Candidatus Marinimicrobia bacterium]|nr:hypothetical protein [Candidatus Neomarinimicrobiota bacterium]|tara:strand:+ start:32814 stop:33929 length:1116 start_codon:yes stop_codon:yes gene_type:complete
MKNIIIQDNNLPYILNNISYSTGGASVQTRNWMYGFEKLGYKIIIISSAKVKNRTNYTIIDTSNKFSFKGFIFLSNIYCNYKILRKYKPAFIYISEPQWSNIYIGVISKLLNIKIIQRISNDNIADDRIKLKFSIGKQKKNKFSRTKYILYKIYLLTIKMILCQNEYQLKLFREKYPNKNLMKIYNPFLINDAIISTKDRFYVAWLGIFQKQKNLEGLFDIAKKLPNIKFKVAGDESLSIDDKTKYAIKQLRKLENVEFVGLVNRNKVLDFLSQALCLLNTSHHEGFSNTFLESISVGTPIVTRQKTDPDGIINKYNLGNVSKTHLGLCESIQKSINNKPDIKLMRKYLLEHHEPITLSRKVIDFIENGNN